VVVLDRSGIDALIDVMTSCGWTEARRVPLGRLYLSLYPWPNTNIYLRVKKESAITRKPEAAFDPKFDGRFALYERLASEHVDITVPTEDPDDIVHQRIWQLLFGGSRDFAVQFGSDSLHAERVTVQNERAAQIVGEGQVSSQGWVPYSVRVERVGRDGRASAWWYEWVKSRRLPKTPQLAILLATHWLFQSILYMDRTEKLFKVGTELTGAAAAALLLLETFGPLPSVLLGLLIAHTANFLLNSHIPVVLKHVNLTTDVDELLGFLNELAKRIEGRPFLEGAVVVGSLARGGLRATSDLDVRVIRFRGVRNGLLACLSAARERLRALVRRIPLDIYVVDSIESLRNLREWREPLVLYDSRGRLAEWLSRGGDV